MSFATKILTGLFLGIFTGLGVLLLLGGLMVRMAIDHL